MTLTDDTKNTSYNIFPSRINLKPEPILCVLIVYISYFVGGFVGWLMMLDYAATWIYCILFSRVNNIFIFNPGPCPRVSSREFGESVRLTVVLYIPAVCSFVFFITFRHRSCVQWGSNTNPDSGEQCVYHNIATAGTPTPNRIL